MTHFLFFTLMSAGSNHSCSDTLTRISSRLSTVRAPCATPPPQHDSDCSALEPRPGRETNNEVDFKNCITNMFFSLIYQRGQMNLSRAGRVGGLRVAHLLCLLNHRRTNGNLQLQRTLLWRRDAGE